MKRYILIGALAILALSCSSPEQKQRVWQTIEKSLQAQLITVEDGDTVNLPEGNFMFTKSLTMDGKNHVVIRGQGKDRTILSFSNQQEGAEGLHISNCKDIVLEDFSLEDAKGDNIKVNDTQGITFRRLISRWSAGPRAENGAYGIYPVLCKNVLISECEVMGSSDAGIYVGQSDSAIIQNNKVYWNVAGIESENSKWVEIHNNEAYDNTGGILVFDLPGLTTYGHSTRVFSNNVHDNNHENFAQKGNIVASIPPGSGVMILATHNLEMFDNNITDNQSVGISVISYELVAAVNKDEGEQRGVGGAQVVKNNYKEDTAYNAFPYKISIHHNRFQNSHWFPSLGNDIGKLLLIKSFFSPPDVLYDGIGNPEMKDRSICIADNGEITFVNLDAGNDFKAFSKDTGPFDCKDSRKVASLRGFGE